MGQVSLIVNSLAVLSVTAGNVTAPPNIIWGTGSEGRLTYGGNDAYLDAINGAGQLHFRTAGTALALTLDASQNATFAKDLDIADGYLHIKQNTNGQGDGLDITRSDTSSTLSIYKGGGTPGDAIFQLNDAGAFAFYNNTATLMAILENGGNLTTIGKITAGGATGAGALAAMGRSASLGLMLTGQGSTNDVTILNDANAAVISIPTGTTGVTFAGAVGFNATAPLTKPAIIGSRAGNAALADLLTQLASYGLITDSTSA